MPSDDHAERTGVYAWRNKPSPESPPPPTSSAIPPSLSDGEANAYVDKAIADEIDNVNRAHEGVRNDTLNAATFSLAQLHHAGLLTAWDEVAAQLTNAAIGRGLTASETAKTIDSAYKAALAKPRTKLPTPTAPIDLSGPVVIDVAKQPDFWDARPELAHLYTFARARRVSPWALLGVTLARIVTAVPPFVQLPALVGGYASLNLFVGVVGKSGKGKGAAEAAAPDALTTPPPFETFPAGSGEAIAHAYMKRVRNGQTKTYDLTQHNTRALFSVAEIDTLAALKDRRSSTVLPELRKAWMGERLGFHYVDPDKRLPVPAHAYRLCLIAGIQPQRAGVLLDDVDGGTPQRFVWVPAKDYDAPDLAPDEPEPWPWRLPSWPMARAGRVVLDVCETARRYVDDARLVGLREPDDADDLDAHAPLARLKIAAALAIFNGRASVGNEDWDLAGTVLTVSDIVRTRIGDALKASAKKVNVARGEAEAERAAIVADSMEDKALKRVCRTIVAKLADGDKTRTGLTRALASRDRVYFDEAVDKLVDAGQIVVVDDDHYGQGKTVYRLVET